MTRQTFSAIAITIAMILGVMVPARTVAQSGECAGVAAWRAALPDPFQPMPGQPSSFTTADDWADAAEAAYRLADAIEDAETPAAAEPARDALIDGYRLLGDYFDGWATMIRTTPAGSFYAYDAMAVIITDLGDGRARLIEGFRLAADLAVACGVADGVADPGPDSCGGVDVWMAGGDAMMRSWWAYWRAWYAESRLLAQQPNVPIGTLIGNWENASGYTFQSALSLAVTPAPDGAAALNAALAALFQNYSTLYLTGMSGVWAGFLGATPEMTQRLTADYNARVSAAIDDYVALQQAWSEVAERCGVDLRLVDMPREVQQAGQ